MKNNKNKRRIALALSLCAFLIFAGSMVAFFSDLIMGEASVTAGTLEIEGSYTFTHYDAKGETLAESSEEIKNFMPGDYILVSVTATNKGSSIAWVRDTFELGGTLYELGQSDSVIKIYKGEVPGTIEEAIDETLSSDPKIVNELESELTSEYSTSYVVYFDKYAGNEAQEKILTIKVQTEALQHHNNSNPDALDWTSVSEANLTSGS